MKKRIIFQKKLKKVKTFEKFLKSLSSEGTLQAGKYMLIQTVSNNREIDMEYNTNLKPLLVHLVNVNPSFPRLHQNI